ncbi:hypothetical protein AB0N05_27670 [Nocardia sp. NPDC051030]|uniref:hypothetical protein n=1 Tax=Nocardia sp. NPDC051030 TaxID=3155162 RepID=UPI00342E7C61
MIQMPWRLFGAATALILTAGLLSGPVASAEDAQAASGERTETVVDLADGIVVSEVKLRSLLHTAAPHPEACDWISYLRYRFSDSPEDPQRGNGVLLAQPFVSRGAVSLDGIARSTLSGAKVRGRSVEWWSLPMRSACAMDSTGLASGDASTALDYYFHGKPIDGHTFAGFGQDRYLSDLGIEQIVRDQYEVLTRELPSPEFRRTKAFCGGHGTGALQTMIFADWDFDGRPGGENCAGLFALDGPLDPDPLMIETNPILKWASGLMGQGYTAAVAAIENGTLPSPLAGLPVLGPEAAMLLPITALEAVAEGDEETTLHQQFPRTGPVEWTNRINFGQSSADIALGTNVIQDYRFSGLGLLGTMIGGTSLNLPIFATTTGTLSGGPVIDRHFPLPGQLRNLPAVGDLFAAFTGGADRVAPTDRTALYGWRNDEDKQPISVIAARMATMLGSQSWVDSTVPTRWAADITAILSGVHDGSLAGFRHPEQTRTLPHYVTVGGNSFHLPLANAGLAWPSDTVRVPGYTQADAVAGGPNDAVVQGLTTFVTG